MGAGLVEKDRENQGHGGQCLLTTGQERHGLGFLARWTSDDVEPGFEGIIGFGQLQFGLTASEQFGKERLEMAIDDIKGGKAAGRGPPC